MKQKCATASAITGLKRCPTMPFVLSAPANMNSTGKLLQWKNNNEETKQSIEQDVGKEWEVISM